MSKKPKPSSKATIALTDTPISGKTLIAQGWQSGPAVGAALKVAQTLAATGQSQGDILALLNRIRTTPDEFRTGDYADLAAQVRPLAPRRELAGYTRARRHLRARSD